MSDDARWSAGRQASVTIAIFTPPARARHGATAPLCVITSLLSVQRSRLSRPLKSSASVVQLSTQSPSLQYRTPSMCEISARWMWPQIAPSRPRRCASCASARSKFAMYFTAFFTLCLRYAAIDQYGAPNARRSRFT